MILQSARADGHELLRAAVEHRMDILPGQSGGIEQPLDIRMLRMNRLGKRAPRRMVSGVNRIRRRTDPRASVPAKIQERERRPRPRRNAGPDPFRDLLQRDVPVPPPHEPVTQHCFYEGGREIGTGVQDSVARTPRAEAGICGTGAQWRRPVARRDDPVAFRNPRL